MTKILTGETYTEPRLYGIIAEMFYSQVGRLARQNDITIMLTGTVITNKLTSEIGYMIDTNSQYFALLPQVHADRLVDIVDGDGWRDTVEEV